VAGLQPGALVDLGRGALQGLEKAMVDQVAMVERHGDGEHQGGACGGVDLLSKA